MQRSIIFPAVLLLAPAIATAQQGNQPKNWSSSIGIGTVAMPTYTGSNRYRVRPVPLLQLEFKERVYVGSSTGGVGGGMGVYLIRGSSLTWSTQVPPGLAARFWGRRSALSSPSSFCFSAASAPC